MPEDQMKGLRISVFLALALALVVACPRRTTPLERLASRIPPGATREEVMLRMVGCNYTVYERGGRMDHRAVLMGNNGRKYASLVIFGSRNQEWMELCEIYFDTNKIVMGYWYSR
jgi:hypothetical protein